MSRSAPAAWPPVPRRRGRPRCRLRCRVPRGAVCGLPRRLRHLARRLLGLLARGVLGRLAGFFFRGLARLLLAPACLLGGRKDRNRLLLAPFRLALGVLALLLDQRALPRGLLGRGQGARDRGYRWPFARRGAGARSRRGCAGRSGPGGRCAWGADRGALLAYLDLHDLGTAMAEALSHGPGVDRAAELQAPRGTQREPALAGILIVGFAHRLPAGPVQMCLLVRTGIAGATVPSQPPEPCRLGGEPFAQSSRRNRNMHHMVTTEHSAKRRRRKRRRYCHRSHRAAEKIARVPPRCHPTPAGSACSDPFAATRAPCRTPRSPARHGERARAVRRSAGPAPSRARQEGRGAR